MKTIQWSGNHIEYGSLLIEYSFETRIRFIERQNIYIILAAQRKNGKYHYPIFQFWQCFLGNRDALVGYKVNFKFNLNG